MMRGGTLVCMLAGLALAAAPASATEPQTSLPDIEDEVMCITCGVVLEHAIDNRQAIQEREQIRRLIDQGLTKDQIKNRLVAEYGEEVLSIPDDEGFDLAAWLVPGAAIIIAAIAIAVGVWRWRRTQPAHPAGDLDPSESDRLNDDLARYEL